MRPIDAAKERRSLVGVASKAIEVCRPEARRRDVSIKLTGEPAGIFRFEDRGVLRPGAFADVCVFEADKVGPGRIRRVRDFPAGADRLTADTPTGIRHVLVNGSPIHQDGKRRLEAVEEKPGRRPKQLSFR